MTSEPISMMGKCLRCVKPGAVFMVSRTTTYGSICGNFCEDCAQKALEMNHKIEQQELEAKIASQSVDKPSSSDLGISNSGWQGEGGSGWQGDN